MFHPFRSVTGRLRASIHEEETLPLGEILKRSGVETIGPAILVLALLSLVPYASVLTGAGLMVVGLGMVVGSRALWLPGWLLKLRMRGRHVHASLGSLERFLVWLGPRRSGAGTAWVVNGRFVGALVLWTAFVLALPVPLPGNNILPAVGLILLGLAVVERRPSLVGLGALFSIAGTAYFVLLGHAAFAAVGSFL